MYATNELELVPPPAIGAYTHCNKIETINFLKFLKLQYCYINLHFISLYIRTILESIIVDDVKFESAMN